MNDLRNLDEGDLRAAVAPMGPAIVQSTVARWKLLLQRGYMPDSHNWDDFWE